MTCQYETAHGVTDSFARHLARGMTAHPVTQDEKAVAVSRAAVDREDTVLLVRPAVLVDTLAGLPYGVDPEFILHQTVVSQFMSS